MPAPTAVHTLRPACRIRRAEVPRPTGGGRRGSAEVRGIHGGSINQVCLPRRRALPFPQLVKIDEWRALLQNTETAAALTGYTPTEEDLRSLEEWFASYDELASSPTPENIERMAGMAVFPLNLVTDGSGGDGRTDQWDRRRYTETMNAVMGGAGDGEVRFESARTPFFLSSSLVVVFTDSVMTAGGEEHRMRYADILVRRGGVWRFQTMVQSGWAEMLEGPRD